MAGERRTLATRPVDAEALYRTQVRPLYTFIYSKVGNREAAEDLTSEANVKVLQHRALKRAAELREDDSLDG